MPSRPPPLPPKKPSHLTSSQSNDAPLHPPSTKRGIGLPWDHPSTLLPLFLTPTSHITWFFNWELWHPVPLPPNLEWIPTVRTAQQAKDILPFLTDIKAKGVEVKCLLGFNEPEIEGQANMSVEEAVRVWRDVVLPAQQKLGLRLGSPGLSSDRTRSVKWMDGFLEGLGGLKPSGIKFLVLHWYGTGFEEFKGWVVECHERWAFPVWVNEVACSKMGDGEVGEQEVEAFMRRAVAWMEETEWVERYAFFGLGQGMSVGKWVGAGNNFLEEADGCEKTEGRRLSNIGKTYCEL